MHCFRVESAGLVFNRLVKGVKIMLKARVAISFLGLAMLLPLTPALPAQTSIAQAAPVPSQVFAAKKVFISNTGAGFESGVWSGGPDRIYNEFYAAMKIGGGYELVSAPGDADLVMDVSVIPGSVTWKFKLEILDPKTRIVLWTVYEPVKIIGMQKTRDKNFDATIDKLVGDLKALSAQPGAVAK
jgi:hypothetical protein